MHRASKMLGAALAALIIGAFQVCPQESSPGPFLIPVPDSLRAKRDTADARVITTPSAQAVLDSAIRLARSTKLEYAGCAWLVTHVGRTFWIAEARIAVIEHDSTSVFFQCETNEVRWHTHYLAEDHANNIAGCEYGVFDWPTTDATMDLVICGIGRDSIVPYHWKRPVNRTINAPRPAVTPANPIDFRIPPDGTTFTPYAAGRPPRRR